MRLSASAPAAALALALAAAPLCPAHAQTPTPSAEAVREARERFQRGVDLTDEGNFSAAMVEFQRAYELTRNPAVLYNISATHEALGRYVEALDAMQRYVAESPAAAIAPRRPQIDAAIARLRARVGTLVVALDVPGLAVRVDGIERPASEARAGMRVSVGRRRIALSAPGFEPREQEVDIAGGATARIDQALARVRSTIAVESNVAGAEVLVDGVVAGRTPLASPLPIGEGLHHVEVRRQGYTTFATDVNALGTGARIQANLAWLDPMPPDVASRLVVRTSESGVLASIDGRRVAIDGSDPVPPGPHRLRLERTDYLPLERDVDLPAGRAVTADAALTPTPASRVSRVVTVRAVGLVTTGLGVVATSLGAIYYVVSSNARAADLAAVSCPGVLMRDACIERMRQTIMTEYEPFLTGGLLTTIAGGALIAVGLGITFAAGLADPGERPPTFQLRAGLNSVGFDVRF